MKKRLIMILLAAMLAFTATGCSLDKDASVNVEDDEDDDRDKDDEDDDRDKDEDDDRDTEDDDRDKDDKDDDKDDMKKPTGAVLGGDFEEDYDGFEYLYCEMLMTDSEENEETGKMESQKLNVFIPNTDYTSVNRGVAYADDKGVEFRVTLNPYIQYNQDDYTVKENLEEYITYTFDPFYCTEYKDVEISEVEGTKNSARATVNYCYYDQWEETYIPIYCTYYLTELSDDVQVLVEIEITAMDVTGKTEELLTEIEAFYGFEIDWNADAAQQKLDNFLANGVTDTVTCSTGYVMFELPEGWETDYGYGDYSIYAYAPDGDYASAQCVLTISREYVGGDMLTVEDIMSEKAEMEKFFREELGDTVSSVDITEYGETCLGDAVKITYTLEENGTKVTGEWYFIVNEGGYLYGVEAMKTEECETDVFAIAADVLTNGVVKED